MKITDIEFIPIFPRLAKRYEKHALLVRGLEYRLIARVKTDVGITGYGDERVRPYWEPPTQAELEPLIDRSPFDFINNSFGFSLGGALYDVMGKYLEIPAYKLMGQKLRDGVSVAAWCSNFPAKTFGEEVARAASQGYSIIKMHTHSLYDPIEQTRAAEAAAPPGFKVHYDFNGGRGRTVAGLLPLIHELETNHPIVGWIEDPLPKHDIVGWRTLREQTRIPIVMHRTLLGGLQEVLHGVADIYMLAGGHPAFSIGDTLSRGTAYGKANIQVIMQLTGGTLAKALAMHMCAVLPTATGHSIDLDDQYDEDVTADRIPVIEGYSPVPEAPGLGYEADEAAISRLAGRGPIEVPKYVGVLTLPSGRKMYSRSSPHIPGLMGREEGTVRGIDFDVWDDDGSPEFEKVYQRLQEEPSFFE